MKVRRALLALGVAAVTSQLLAAQPNQEAYLSWSAKQAETVGAQMYKKGRVGGGRNLLNTERAYSYKLAATWLTPDVIRATARRAQLSGRLSDNETRDLVKEAETLSHTVIMVEIDPNEGSGVIPNDWQAFLQPQGRPDAAVRGTVSPHLREVKGLAGVRPRNYDYDRFWVSFPLTSSDGRPVFSPRDQNAELVVRIYAKEGHVEWPIPSSIRQSRYIARRRYSNQRPPAPLSDPPSLVAYVRRSMRQ